MLVCPSVVSATHLAAPPHEGSRASGRVRAQRLACEVFAGEFLVAAFRKAFFGRVCQRLGFDKHGSKQKRTIMTGIFRTSFV